MKKVTLAIIILVLVSVALAGLQAFEDTPTWQEQMDAAFEKLDQSWKEYK